MSAPVSIVGSVQTGERHNTTMGENHYCCSWKIEQISLYISTAVQSPIFTVSNTDKFKWRFSIISFSKRDDRYDFVVGLVLDPTSEVDEANAKIKLTVLSKINMHQCDLYSGQSYKFFKNSKNILCIASSVSIRELYCDQTCYCFLTIVCEMKIESAIPDESDEYSLPKDLAILLDKGLFTDVVLSVGGKIYPAHKAILAARSAVFAAKFTHDVAENQGVVRIEDVEEGVVEEMLRYIYTGEVEKLNDLAQVLFIAADKYDLSGLRIKCEKIMIANLSSSNAFDLLLFADSYNSSKLKSEAINFIAVTSTQLERTSAWETICQSNPKLHREISEAVFGPKFTSAELD